MSRKGLSSPRVPRAQRVIFAMGGGGFTMEPFNPLLDDFILSLALHAQPRILFLPTASGDTGAQIRAFYTRYSGRVCVPEHLSLFHMHDMNRPLADIVLEQDIVYTGGGSMRNLLAIWRAHGLDEILISAWERGVVLAGLSAGAMCWFEGGVTRSSGPATPIVGLGLLAGSLTVHADGEPDRLPVWLASISDGTLPGGWAADDGVGLCFRGGHLQRVVSSRPGAFAQRVDAVAGELVRDRLKPELLGSGGLGGSVGIDDDVQELRDVVRLRERLAQTSRLGRP
ncbi:MAG: Type 1 glutamine amidotransferase-like domain-containing protein [Solirubrobacteraceae bacterium]